MTVITIKHECGRASEREKKTERSLDQDVRLHTHVFTVFLSENGEENSFRRTVRGSFSSSSEKYFRTLNNRLKSVTNEFAEWLLTRLCLFDRRVGKVKRDMIASLKVMSVNRRS